MRIKIISMLTGLIMAVFMVTASANSGVNLDANHQIISSIANGSGLNTITVEITLNNTSTTDLNNIQLELMEEEGLILINTSDLTISNINAGTSATVSWIVISPLTADYLINLNMSGDAQDNIGQTHALSVRSVQ